MLQTLLTLVMLASGPSGSANQVPANNGLYDLQLAFQQAQVESVDEASALPLEMAQADQRVAEAEAAAQQGDQAAADKALGQYDNTLTMLTEDVMSADGIDTDAVMEQINGKLAEHGKKIKGIKGQEGDDQDEDGGGNNGVCTRTDHPLAQKIAEQFGATPDQVMGWFCGDDHLGFGGIMLALRMSQESGKSVDEILALHASGESWGQIKHELGVIGKGHAKHNHGNGNGNANGNGNKNGGGNGHGNGNGNANGNGNKNGGGNGHGNGGDDQGESSGGDTGGDDRNTGVDSGGSGGDDNQNLNSNDNTASNDNTVTNENENLNTNTNDNSIDTNSNVNDNT